MPNGFSCVLRDTALIDRNSKQSKFPFPLADNAALAREQVELAGKRITLVGTFTLGTDFAHDGNLVMSAENFAEFLSPPPSALAIP